MQSAVRSKRSPSQFATWLDCPRKWAFSRVTPSPPNRFAELGQNTHAVLEAWLRDGVPFPDTLEGRIAMAGLHHLPEPGTVLVETDFKFDRGTWIAHGRRDFVVPDGPGQVPVVGDHKTTSDLKWAKSEDDLRADPQGVIYAASVMIEYGTEIAELDWIYYQTKEPHRSKRVHLRMYLDDVSTKLETFDAIAVEMDSFTGAPVKDVPYQATACDKYGGCPYVVECGLTSQERFGSIMNQSALAEKLKARMNGGAGAQGVNPPESAPAPAPKPESTPPAASGAAEKLRARAAAAKPVEAPAEKPAAPAPVADAAVEKLAERTVREDSVATARPALAMRDLIAANAMAGILSNPANTGWSSARVASEAFAIADEMIKARG